jgi:hypothetical protein
MLNVVYAMNRVHYRNCTTTLIHVIRQWASHENADCCCRPRHCFNAGHYQL